MNVIERLSELRIIPVVVLPEPGMAAPLADALVEGGLPVIEVTLRTPGALEGMRTLGKRDDILVGAGTVLTVSQVDQAVEAGARYIVSPGSSDAVITRCEELGVPILPGAVTATEIQALLERGITTAKFFPASTSGGAPAIKAFGSPFSQVKFVPTGGINADNLAEYATLPNVAAIGGSWMVPASAMIAGDFARIASLCADARHRLELL